MAWISSKFQSQERKEKLKNSSRFKEACKPNIMYDHGLDLGEKGVKLYRT